MGMRIGDNADSTSIVHDEVVVDGGLRLKW
jgi:hypothetical protein